MYSRVGSPSRQEGSQARSASEAPTVQAVPLRSPPPFAFSPQNTVAQFPHAMGQGRGPPYFVPPAAVRVHGEGPQGQPGGLAPGDPLVENQELSPFRTQQNLQQNVNPTEYMLIHTPEGSAHGDHQALVSQHPTVHIPKTSQNVPVSPPGFDSLYQTQMDMDVDASVNVHNEVHNSFQHNELNQNFLNVQLNADNSGIVNEAWSHINQANLDAAHAKAETAAAMQFAESQFSSMQQEAQRTVQGVQAEASHRVALVQAQADQEIINAHANAESVVSAVRAEATAAVSTVAGERDAAVAQGQSFLAHANAIQFENEQLRAQLMSAEERGAAAYARLVTAEERLNAFEQEEVSRVVRAVDRSGDASTIAPETPLTPEPGVNAGSGDSFSSTLSRLEKASSKGHFRESRSLSPSRYMNRRRVEPSPEPTGRPVTYGQYVAQAPPTFSNQGPFNRVSSGKVPMPMAPSPAPHLEQVLSGPKSGMPTPPAVVRVRKSARGIAINVGSS